jgi:hypothetical protein
MQTTRPNQTNHLAAYDAATVGGVKMTYTTYGSIRGGCDHRHATKAAAEKCLAHDQAGYSDREIVLVGDDGYLYRDMGQFAAEDGDHWIRGPGGSSGVQLGQP